MEKNIGIMAAARQWAKGYRGAGVTVAVIDSGVDPHPELDGRVERATCCWLLPSTDAGLDETGTGHGTHVAGIIAGKTVGMAPDARILSVKVFSGMGECYSSDVADGIRYATTKGVQVINLSLQTADNPEIHSAIQAAVASGILVVCAAGNSGGDYPIYPAAYDEVVSVGAVDVEKRVALFSQRNGAVDLSAPGVDIRSAWLHGGYTVMSGTSMASPHVAGMAALLTGEYRQRFGEWMPEKDLFRALMMQTVDIGVAGRDNETGVGFATFGMGREIRFKPGEKMRWVDGVPQPIDAAPALVPPGRTFGPFTHLAEPFGIVANWKDGVASFWG